MSAPSINTKLLIFLSVLAGVIALPQAAAASKSQLSIMEDNGLLQRGDPKLRASTLDEMKSLGTDVVKVFVHWRDLAPAADSKTMPANFDPTDIGQYDGGRVALYHAIDQEIRDRGMRTWFLLGGPAPDWALGAGAPRGNNVYKPSAVLFGQFAQAIGSGFRDVGMWSIWNEPNHGGFLAPSYGRFPKSRIRGSLSAIHYRSMYREAQQGLATSGNARDAIFFGELLPIAGTPKRASSNVPPIQWMRDFFCLDTKLRPLRGRAAKALDCRRFRRVTTSGFAYHPYTRPARPFRSERRIDSAPLINMKRVYQVLDYAAKARRVRRGLRVYNTEFGFQSNKPDPFWTLLSRIPTYLNQAEYLSYKDRRLASYSQYQLQDDPLLRQFDTDDSRRYSSFQMGLYFEDGRPKSRVHQAYRLPIVVSTTSRSSKVKVWGTARALPSGFPIKIQAKVGKTYRTIKTITPTGSRGYFATIVRRSGANRLLWRLSAGEITSRSSRAGKEIKPSGSLRRR